MTQPQDLHQDPQRELGTALPHQPRLALRLADGIDRIVSVIAQLVLVITGLALLALLFANVVARYVMGGGLSFAQELPERLFPLFIMAGIALAAQRGAHMAVEALPDVLGGMFGRRANQIVRIVSQLFTILTHVIVTVVALQVAAMSWIDLSPVLGLPASYSYLALAAGSAAVIAVTLALLVRLVLIGPEAMPVPNPEETGQ